MAWQPATIRRFIDGIPSSARTAIVATDAGTGYLKALGGPEGPHTLACELVASRLAAWLGLPVLDHAIIPVDKADEVWFFDKKKRVSGRALPGPAFITRGERGTSWSGGEGELRNLSNPDDIGRLVVFDTWVLNCDRHGPPEAGTRRKIRVNHDNVFLSAEAPKGKFRLKAIDHTHCFTCGHPLTVSRLRDIGRVKDGRVFGLFPAFKRFLKREVVSDAAKQLRGIDRSVVASNMHDLPNDWEVRKEVQEAWVQFIVSRAMFVGETIEAKLWPQTEFDFSSREDQP